MNIQRCKVGSQSTIQIGPVDHGESNRQTRYLKRKARHVAQTSPSIKRPTEEPTSSTALGTSSTDSYSSDNTAAEAPDIDSNVETDSPVTFNCVNVTKISAAAIRYGVSNRATAAISTATLAAAKDAGLILDEVQAIDHQNIRRAKCTVMIEIQEHSRQAIKEADIRCVFFDGRKDTTKEIQKGEDVKLRYGEIKEEHISVCSEPGGEYLCHLTVDPKDRENTPS